MQLRREKGLCYTCDDKFTPTHKCPNKQYLLLCFTDAKDQHPDKDFPTASIEDIEHTTDNALQHHLLYNALKGSTRLGTMRFHGSINGLTVQILLNIGNSDNFLHPRIAQHLKLLVEPISSFLVLVGNGNALRVEGLVNAISVLV